MTVPALSLETVRAELADVAAYAAAAGLQLDAGELAENCLRFVVVFPNAHGDHFTAEFDCADYPRIPPTIEFVGPATCERGLKSLYPNVFHSMPCICARYNRKAYAERGGPHGDWRLMDWKLATGAGVPIDTLAMMVSDLHSKIVVSTGRLA